MHESARSLRAVALNQSPIANHQSPPVEVVAGVIRDARGRILLARRTEGRDLAGQWEFPGGKREPGESAEDALIRELREELGIDARVGARLIQVPQQYPHKRLRLDVRLIESWQGQARGREGQALAWVPEHKLASYDMPPADRPVVAALLQPAHYLVTPEPEESGAWLKSLERSFAAGIKRVQLRARTLPASRWQPLARQAALLCRDAGVEVLVNGDAVLATELGVGLHLQAEQLAQCGDRPLPDGLPLAASCHDLSDLQRAQALACDFAVLGSVATTASHPDGETLGWEGFSALREQVSLPIYPIGGMTPGDVGIAREHGGQGIAAIRALWVAGTNRSP